MSRLARWATILIGCALAVTVGLVPIGAMSAAQSEEVQFNTAPIAWEACEQAPVAGLECAVYEVPLDYRDPSGEKIELALRRMPANEAEPIGTLFFNPGGPGGTGSGQFVEWLGQFPAPVREQFDLVSWDPRGIGESTSVQCFASPEAEGEVLGGLGAIPVSFIEQEAFVAGWQAFAEACAEA